MLGYTSTRLMIYQISTRRFPRISEEKTLIFQSVSLILKPNEAPFFKKKKVFFLNLIYSTFFVKVR